MYETSPIRFEKLGGFTKYLLSILPFILILGCGQLNPNKQDTQPFSHEMWNLLLQKHVNNTGNVNYIGFLQDSMQLNQYLTLVSDNPPNDSLWNENEKIAYWINAYNAFTAQLILRNYPIASIKDIGSIIQVPFINSPWDIKFIRIGDQFYDLNNIEHNILRKNWNEPRIHFAINCASISCPRLRNEAYTADKLESQLEQQAVEFMNDYSKNEISSEKAQLSKIFSWFSSDFEKKSSLIEFINSYSKTRISTNTEISFKEYNWHLNSQVTNVE
jgi:hypothetical protein